MLLPLSSLHYYQYRGVLQLLLLLLAGLSGNVLWWIEISTFRLCSAVNNNISTHQNTTSSDRLTTTTTTTTTKTTVL